MTKYRILEKEGTQVPCKSRETERRDDCDHYNDHYIRKFVVQKELEYSYNQEDTTDYRNKGFFTDIKEFTSLYEASNFKRSLELKEGIMIE